MPRICMAVVMLFLSSCVGGGGPQTDSAASKSTGTMSIQLKSKNDVSKTLASVSPDPQFVRVSITNPSLIVAGRSFKVIQNVQIGSTDPVQFVLPIGNGYQVEALYYAEDTVNAVKVMQQYGVATGINLTVDSVTTISLDISPITVTLTPVLPNGQDFIFSGVLGGSTADNYDMVATFPAASPLQGVWTYYAQVGTPFTVPKYRGGTVGTNHVGILAPNSFIGTKLYYQGGFYAKNSLLDTGESYTSWTFNYPNPDVDPTQTPSITMGLRGANVSLSGASLFADTYPPRVSHFTVPSGVQASATLAPISVQATDNVSITDYQVQETGVSSALSGLPAADPANDPGTGWVTALPTSYAIKGALVAGKDNFLMLYVRARDGAGNVSAPLLSQAITVHP